MGIEILVADQGISGEAPSTSNMPNYFKRITDAASDYFSLMLHGYHDSKAEVFKDVLSEAAALSYVRGKNYRMQCEGYETSSNTSDLMTQFIEYSKRNFKTKTVKNAMIFQVHEIDKPRFNRKFENITGNEARKLEKFIDEMVFGTLSDGSVLIYHPSIESTQQYQINFNDIRRH